MTLRTLNYGNYGIFLIMGNAGFCPSTVLLLFIFLVLLISMFPCPLVPCTVRVSVGAAVPVQHRVARLGRLSNMGALVMFNRALGFVILWLY